MELNADAGAVDASLNIQIVPLSDGDLPALDPGLTNVGKDPIKGYRFLPHGVNFKQKISIKLSL